MLAKSAVRPTDINTHATERRFDAINVSTTKSARETIRRMNTLTHAHVPRRRGVPGPEYPAHRHRGRFPSARDHVETPSGAVYQGPCGLVVWRGGGQAD